MVQEALLYAPWPPALLELPEFAEVRDKAGGELLFRGPRLKMVRASSAHNVAVVTNGGRVWQADSQG